MPSSLINESYGTFCRTPLLEAEEKVAGISEEQERSVILDLLEELNLLYRLDLSVNISFNRKVGNAGAREHSFIVVGGSHAARLGHALLAMGLNVSNLGVPGWSISNSTVEETRARLAAALGNTAGDATVVLIPFDNNCYFASTGIGTKCPPLRDEGGRWHIPGRLAMASKDDIKEMVNVLYPILKEAPQLQKLIISPMPRYLDRSCCDSAAHIVNRTEQEYRGGMLERLAEIKLWMRDALHRRGAVLTRTVSSLEALWGRDRDDNNLDMSVFGRDQIHLSESGYKRVAQMIRDLSNTLRSESGTALRAARTAQSTAEGPSSFPKRRQRTRY